MGVWTLVKKPFFARYQQPWVWPEAADRAAWERVEFTNTAGAVLVGLYGKSAAGDARGVIVVPHPMIGTAKGWHLTSGHADRLRRGGFDVLLFDFNGFGESQDGGIDFPGDILSAGREAAKRGGGVPVGLFGISMGAGYGICAMDHPDQPFRAAIIESAFSSLEEYWKHFRFAYVVLRTLGTLMPGSARKLRPIDRIGTIRGLDALLLIYGDSDKVAPSEMGKRLHDASALPADKRSLWVVPGGRHLRLHAQAGDEYWNRVVGFFERSLGSA